MKTSDFDYNLPKSYIAQTPLEPRDSTRLMVVERETGKVIEHTIFSRIGHYLRPGDLLVINQTRVIPARLFGRKALTGGKVELLLLQRIRERIWECLIGGKGIKIGTKIVLEEGITAEILADLEGSKRLIGFSKSLSQILNSVGEIPLPPYIYKKLSQPNRYQTVFAKEPGSVAAPTAGLHFTPSLIEKLKRQGINFTTVTLHIGLDTFAPVKEEKPRNHEIHSEWCQVTSPAVELINQTKMNGGRIIAVGTTSVRTLESAAKIQKVGNELVKPYSGFTRLYILPGYNFLVVDAMITNFHLPRSTLIMMVSAFFGRENVLSAYETAKLKGYRFYSFGDAMLII